MLNLKIRKEQSGLHLFDRVSGYHVLLDEVKVNPNELSISPRTVSIAITDSCDLNCSNCYMEKKGNFLKKNQVFTWCKELDSLGTLDIALGGGEPTLHPDLIDICKYIWKETKMGVTITTHGYNLTEKFIDEIKNFISILRISIDGNEISHFERRKKRFSDLLPILKYLNGRVKFGLNFLLNKDTINMLDDNLIFAKGVCAEELLILPMVVNGEFALNNNNWETLNNWLSSNYKDFPIRITDSAKEHLTVPILFKDSLSEKSYAYISADKKWKVNSFAKNGLDISKFKSLKDLIINIEKKL